MSSQNGAVRQPAGDLSAFDLSKRSPEEIARLFARWKQQREALQAAQQAAREPTNAPKSRSPRLMPVIARNPAAPAVEPTPAAAEPRQPGFHSLRYSAPFAAVLEAGADVAHPERFRKLQLGTAERAARFSRRTINLGEPLPLRGAARRSKSRWVLAGAASILALAAASGAALWDQVSSLRSGWTHSESALPVVVTPSAPAQPNAEVAAIADPTDARMAAQLLPAATRLSATVPSPWPMAVDVALMQPASPASEVAHVRLAPRLKPQPVAVQTASEGTQEPPPIVSSGVEIKADKITPAAGVRNPSAVSVAIPTASAPQSQTEDESDSSSRPESLYRRGNDKEFGGGNNGATHGGHGPHGSGASSAGSGAPGGSAGGSDGSPGGSDNPGGSGASGGTSGGDTGSSGGSGAGGTGSGGNTAGGSPGGGDTGGSTGGGDTGGGVGGGDTSGGVGGGDTGGGTGGSDTGGSTSGGDTGGGDTSGGTGGGDTGGGTGGGGDTGSGDTGGGDTGGATGGSTGGSDTGGSTSSDSGGISGGADVDVGGGGISGSIGGSVGGIGGSISGGIGLK